MNLVMFVMMAHSLEATNVVLLFTGFVYIVEMTAAAEFGPIQRTATVASDVAKQSEKDCRP